MKMAITLFLLTTAFLICGAIWNVDFLMLALMSMALQGFWWVYIEYKKQNK